MSLTVADLALAIGKDENYVRQHIRRKNLEARKDGRRVFVRKQKRQGGPRNGACHSAKQPEHWSWTTRLALTVRA